MILSLSLLTKIVRQDRLCLAGCTSRQWRGQDTGRCQGHRPSPILIDAAPRAPRSDTPSPIPLLSHPSSQATNTTTPGEKTSVYAVII